MLKFPKARLQHKLGKNWQGEQTGHQKYYTKLAQRYYGPFQIQEPINEMTYKLKLQSHWKIQSAFEKVKYALQYSQLKQKLATDKHIHAIKFKNDDWVLLQFTKAQLKHTTGKNS